MYLNRRLQLLPVENGNADNKADCRCDGGNGQGQGICSWLFHAVNKGISIHQQGGQVFADIGEDPQQDAEQNDAACSGNPGKMEYRGVYLRTGKEIFHYGPVWGTNNIGEFLAIVHGLALLKQKGLHTMPIYSDSVNAQLWVKRKKCKTTLERNEKSEALYQLIERAEKWLRENPYQNPIIKWPTEEWGEIPADFGRKH